MRRNTHDSETLAYEQRIASSIATRLVAEVMTLPVELNNQSALQASEIGSYLSNRELPSEFQALRSFAKLLPEEDFRQAHLAP